MVLPAVGHLGIGKHQRVLPRGQQGPLRAVVIGGVPGAEHGFLKILAPVHGRQVGSGGKVLQPEHGKMLAAPPQVRQGVVQLGGLKVR